jgi:pimeloyl-ACP methyl ester carboxylesterase
MSTPSRSQRHWLPSVDLHMAIQTWGPKNGPLVVALHGWLDNSASFGPLAKYLPDARIFAIDFFGHGHSDPLPPSSLYSSLACVQQVHGFCQALNLQDFYLLGHSLGGGTAALYSSLFPNCVRKLILLEATIPSLAEEKELYAQTRNYLETAPAKKSSPWYASIEAAAQARSEKSGLSLTSSMWLAKRGTQAEGEGVVWRTDPRLTVPVAHPYTDTQVQIFLQHLQTPTLVITAKDGYLFRYPQATRWTQGLANAVQVEVPGEHHVHMENPEMIAERIRGEIV